MYDADEGKGAAAAWRSPVGAGEAGRARVGPAERRRGWGWGRGRGLPQGAAGLGRAGALLGWRRGPSAGEERHRRELNGSSGLNVALPRQICSMMRTTMRSPPTCGKKPAGSLLGDFF